MVKTVPTVMKLLCSLCDVVDKDVLKKLKYNADKPGLDKK